MVSSMKERNMRSSWDKKVGTFRISAIIPPIVLGTKLRIQQFVGTEEVSLKELQWQKSKDRLKDMDSITLS